MDESDDDSVFEYMGLSQRARLESKKKKKLSQSSQSQRKKIRTTKVTEENQKSAQLTDNAHSQTQPTENHDTDIIFEGATSSRTGSTQSRNAFLANLEETESPIPLSSSTPESKMDRVLVADSASSPSSEAYITAPSGLRDQVDNNETGVEDGEEDSVPENERNLFGGSEDGEEVEFLGENYDGAPVKMSLEFPTAYTPVKIKLDQNLGRLDVELRKRVKQTSITDFFGGKSNANFTPTTSKQTESERRRNDGAGPSGTRRPTEDERRASEVTEFKNVTGWRCPSYKRVPGSRYVVDAFAYGYIEGVTGYFLSHFHWDHYNGLNKSFKKPVYCSQVTANLVALKLKVDRKYLNVLDLNKPHSMEDGTTVTLIDANHCPGSVMFLFRTPDRKCHLHCGDMRAEESLIMSEHLRGVSIDNLFLDTTYCDPEYVFPSQKEVIEACVKAVLEETKKKPNSLIVCGTYTIGKEKVLKALTEALGTKIGVSREKLAVLKCQEDERLNRKLTTDYSVANLHVVFGKPNDKTLSVMLDRNPRFSHVICVWPSGWELSGLGKGKMVKISRRGKVTKIGVPYSEHSSFTELKKFVQMLKPKTVIPTVPSKHRKEMQEMFFGPWLRDSGLHQSDLVQFLA